MRQISILGCGWLGLPLAKQLIQNGYLVKGSTTSADKLPLLESFDINPFKIVLNSKEIEGPIDAFFDQSDILIVDIPPKLRSVEKDDFVAKIELLIPEIEKANVSKVIFISATSVYADCNEIVTEDSIALPETESGIQLLATESLLKNSTAFKTTVVRFGGLIGQDRHPIRFLAGRNNIENPNSPINLIHLDDCIGIIASIIDRDCWGETFNAVTPYHPLRKDYYTEKALAMNLDLPEFNLDSVSNGKTISSVKIQTVLNYEFKINPL
jgi:nucleoside-diphosphate-sugar epimerase